MDTSESEHSDMEEASDNDDWVPIRKQNSKTSDNASTLPTEVCCKCSKKSLCKLRCDCRAAGNSCGATCGCVSTRCTNRDTSSDANEESKDAAASNEITKGDLISQGAVLLQSALSDTLGEGNDHQKTRRKPLSDIGNTVVSRDFNHLTPALCE